MGKGFGELAKISGIVTFRLSPHELKAFSGSYVDFLRYVGVRVSENILRVGPPFLVSFWVYEWATHEHKALSRKNPKDYENDV